MFFFTSPYTLEEILCVLLHLSLDLAGDTVCSSEEILCVLLHLSLDLARDTVCFSEEIL